MEFTFEDEPIICANGDTIASALISGPLGWRESPEGLRGLFCGMGICHECAVVVDGGPGVRACMTPAKQGIDVRRQSFRAELHPPAGAWDERVVAPEILVIGGGPAGLAAASAAAEAGARVVVVDERKELGGQYFKQPATGRPERDSQQTHGRRWIDRVGSTGATILYETQVWGADSPGELYALGPAVSYTLRPGRLILATGACERAVAIPGWTLPGFMTAGAAQTLLRSYGVAPGRRVLVCGNGPFLLQVAVELLRAGAIVVGVAELSARPHVRHGPAALAMAATSPSLTVLGLRYLSTLRRAGVPLMYGSAVIRAEGGEAVSRAIVAAVDSNGLPRPGTERSFDVDAICAGFGFTAATELARHLGCTHENDERHSQLESWTDSRGKSDLETVWVVGDGARVAGAPSASSAGFLAGLDAARSLGFEPSRRLEREERRAVRAGVRAGRFQRALWSLYRAPNLIDQLATPETLVCRCENVTLRELTAAFESGNESAGSVKRATRAGMGRCQGRYCGAVLVELARRRHGGVVTEADWLAPQAPVRLVPVSQARSKS